MNKTFNRNNWAEITARQTTLAAWLQWVHVGLDLFGEIAIYFAEVNEDVLKKLDIPRENFGGVCPLVNGGKLTPIGVSLEIGDYEDEYQWFTSYRLNFRWDGKEIM